MPRVSPRQSIGWLVIAIGVVAAVAAQGPDDLSPSVVKITTSSGQGSGVVVAVEPEGVVILTMYHVLRGADSYSVVFAGAPGRGPIEVSRAAAFIGWDSEDDTYGLAAFRVREAVPNGVRPAALGTGASLTRGDPLVYWGYPNRSTTVRRISASLSAPEGTKIVIDRSLGEGASGGAIVKEGKVVALAAAREGEQVSYAVMSEVAALALRGWGITLTATTSTAPAVAMPATTTASPTRPAAVQPVRLSTLRGHTGKIWSARFDSRGTRVVTASEDMTARVWEVETGKELLTLRGHTSGVAYALFNPTLSDIITSGDDAVRIWGPNGFALGPVPGAGSWIAPRYDPRGRRVVVDGRDSTAVVTGLVPEVVTLVGHTDSVEGARFSPAGERVVTASRDGTARIWNAADGRLLVTLKGHTDYVFDAAFSPDSRHVVTASRDNTVRIWNAVSGEAMSTLYGHTEMVFSAGFSPDGERVVSVGGDRTVRTWGLDGKLYATIMAGPDGRPTNSLLSADNTIALLPAAAGTVEVWRVFEDRRVATVSGLPELTGLDISDDGQRIALSHDATVDLWSVGQSAK